MRPIQRGAPPQLPDFSNYDDAKPLLVSRLGPYCSYCERRVATNLAVEHIQPKALPAYSALIGRWQNFLLGCINCNSTKGQKDVVLSDVLLPDRDNTAAAFDYAADGTVKPKVSLNAESNARAEGLLKLVGMDKPSAEYTDENGKQVALDRVAQRMEVWGIAEMAFDEMSNDPGNTAIRGLAIELAKAYGFFSIWMTVFAGDIDMRHRLIEAFKGTRGSGCFAATSTALVAPAPNPDGLPHGGKL